MLLSLESSGPACSVALHNHGDLVALLREDKPQQASSRLAVMIDELLQQAGATMKDLTAVAVSGGPGSYTGLRIGVSTAKGICFALGIPLVAVNTLTVMAHHVRTNYPEDGWLCPMLDARRMEVYCQVMTEQLDLVEATRAVVVDHESFKHMLDIRPVTFFGDGAGKCEAVIQHPNARFLPGVVPLASDLGALAATQLSLGNIVSLVDYEPFYLKEFQTKASLG